MDRAVNNIFGQLATLCIGGNIGVRPGSVFAQSVVHTLKRFITGFLFNTNHFSPSFYHNIFVTKD